MLERVGGPIDWGVRTEIIVCEDGESGGMVGDVGWGNGIKSGIVGGCDTGEGK